MNRPESPRTAFPIPDVQGASDHRELAIDQVGIRGLRYPVEALLEYLAGGDTVEDILAEFPDLEREDLQACLQFAARSLKLKSLHFVAA